MFYRFNGTIGIWRASVSLCLCALAIGKEMKINIFIKIWEMPREDDIGARKIQMAESHCSQMKNSRILENRMVRGEQLPFLMCRRTTFFDWRQKNVAVVVVVVAVVVIFWQVLKHINDLIYTIQNSNHRIKTKLEETLTHTCLTSAFVIYGKFEWILFVRDIFCVSLARTQTNTLIFDECSYVSNHNVKVNTKEISLVATIYLGEKTTIPTRAHTRSNVIFD